MKHDFESQGCPISHGGEAEDNIVMSTNWEYLQGMKINPLAPSPNMAAVTRPDQADEKGNFVPWFWPDAELADAVKVRQAAYLSNKDRVLATAGNDPVVRAASQQLLWLQSRYLSEHFPDKYAIETSGKYGKVIINSANPDKIDAFQILPEKKDWHPLAISGMLGQEDICMVRRKKSGKQALVAGFLASPTNWNLSSFMNTDMDTIHRHVKGYHKPARENSRYKLKDTVDKFLESLRVYPEGITWRNNQFIEYIPTLAREPDDDAEFDEKRIIKNPGENIYLRTERETLTRLPEPYDDFVVFTIKPHVFRMSDVQRLRRDDFVRSVATNSVIRSALKSEKKAKQKFDFTETLTNYLSQRSDPSELNGDL